MDKLFIRLMMFSYTLILVFFTVNVYANEGFGDVDEQLPSIKFGNSFVNLTYKDNGFNTYTYSGRGSISCKSGNTDYVLCSVDQKSKKITLTPVKKTNSDVTITVSSSNKSKMVKNNANIQYEGEDEMLLEELKNPVVQVEYSDIAVPDTASTVEIAGIIIGIGLIAGGGYTIYRKYKFGN